MTVYLVGAGPGDPKLLTCRAAELLARADVVVHDRLVDPRVLAEVRPGALLVDVGKRPGELQRQDRINDLLVEHGKAGKLVVRLKGGDPFVFGRGGEEAAALKEAGVPFEVVPGVSSAVAAPAYAGIPVTHRNVASSFTVVTGHVEGGSGGVDWESLARAGGTLVVLMGIANRAEIASRLMAAGRDPSTPVAAISWGTTPSQRVSRTTLGRLGETNLEPPATIVIGPVAGMDLSWFGGGPLEDTSVVVTRAEGQAADLVEALEGAGAQVVHLPVIAICDPSDEGAELKRALERVGSYDWMVFTSANAVHRTLGSLEDIRDLAGVRIGVVGPVTADAVRSYRLRVDLVAEEPGGAGLAAAMPALAALPRGGEVATGSAAYAGESHAMATGAGYSSRGSGRILYPRAKEVRTELANGLREKGWIVDEVEAYRTVPAHMPEGASARVLERATRADVVVFASPSAVRAYVDVIAREGAGPLPKAAACIGPLTARAALAAGFDVVVSASGSLEKLVDGLIAWRLDLRAARAASEGADAAVAEGPCVS